MKHLLKRTLALILSVLMVLGTLPTTAWAARTTDDEAQETPVLDPEDRVVDTLRKEEDGETPEQPTDPENPVDPAWNDMTVESLEVKSDGTWKVVISRPISDNSVTGAWGLILAPNVRKTPGVGEDTFLPSALKEQFAGANVVANMVETLGQAALPAGSYLAVGTTDDLSFTSSGVTGDTKTYLTITSQDWGKLPTMESLRTNLAGFLKETGTVAATDTTLPFYAVFFSKQGTVGVADKTTDMVWENTTFELVADPTSIDSSSIASLIFDLKNADSAGVPSVVDKITFVGNYANDEAANVTFAESHNGQVAMGATKSVTQNAEAGKTFRGAQGYITVDYHKNGDPGAKKTLTIQVFPTKTGELWTTPIVISIKAGDPAKTGSTIISNGWSDGIAILNGTDTYAYTDDFSGGYNFSGTIVDNCVPETGLDGLVVTQGTIPYGTLVDGEYGPEIGTGEIAAGSTLEIKDIISVFAPKGAVSPGEHHFTLSLNRVTNDGLYGGGTLPVEVTVIVEVDQEWTVTFHENYGSDTTHDVTVADGANVAPYNVTRSGWTLEGWYFDQGCSDGQKVTFPYKPTADIDLYAKWSQDLSTVTFDANGGSVADSSKLSQTGAPGAAVDDPAPTRAGYSLDGWVKEGETTPVAIGTIKFPASGTEKYTAKWTPLYTYKLVYDLKGGSGGPTAPDPDGPTTATSKTWTLTKNPAPTKSGYEFKGWATTDGGTTAVTSVTATAGSTAAGGTITTTVYAIWSQKTFQIKYHYSGAPSGQNPPDEVTVNAADTGNATLANLPTLTGWTITGWFTGTDSAATGATPATVPLNQANGAVVHLWAKWVRNSYTVTYDVNGGKETYDNGTFTYGSNYTIPAANKPTRDNHRFTGWLATAGATGTHKEGETVTTGAANINLQAQWQGLSWVTFDPNGGKWGAETDPKTYQGDTSAVLGSSNHPTAPTKDGYTFGGWKLGENTYTNDNGTNGIEKETFPATAGAVTADTTKTYTAIWNVQQRTVTFKLNYGENATHDTKSTSYNTALGAGNYPTNPTRTGYQFMGWFPNADGSGTEFTNATAVTENINVYAKWSPDEHTITYAPGVAAGATIADANKTQAVHYDDTNVAVKKSDIITGTATGWNFVDWLSGTTHYAGDGSGKIATITGDMTLTAQWTMDMQFNWNLPSGESTSTTTPTTQKIAEGDALNSVPAGATDVAHYTFKEWNTAQDGSGTKVVAATTFNAPGTLYAQWTPKNYTITWDGNGGGWTSPTATTKTESRAYDSVIPIYGTEPTRTYYTFNGWYTEPACTNKVTFSETAPKVTGNMTYYAGWTQKTSNVVINFKKTAVGAAAADFDVSGEVTLNGTAYKATVTNGHTVKISGVPQGTTSYNVYFAGVDTTETVTVVDGTDGADMTTPVTVDFYEMEVKTNDKGTGTVTAANTALVMTAAGAKTTTLSASTTSSTGDKIIVMAGGKVDWSYSETTANYTFDYWDSDTTANKNNPSVPSAGAAASHTAYFTKSSFDAFLVVKSNTKPQIDYTKDIKKVELMDGSGTSLGTPSYDTSHWKVTAISNDKSGNWKVTTVDGGTYTVPMLKDETDQTMDLFGVKAEVTASTGGLTAKVKAPTSTAPTSRVVVPLGTAVTATETHSNGYSLVEWQDTADPAKAHVSFTGTNKATVTLQDNEGTANDYTSTTDLVITPTYTFEVPVELHYGSATGQLVPDQDVTVTGATVANAGTGNTGKFVISEMTPGTTYNVVVNGYASELTLGSAMASTTAVQKVVLRQITAKVDPSAAGGTPKVNSAAGATGIYVPNKAALTNEDGKPKVTVSVDDNPAAGYRWRNNGTEKLWDATGSPTIVSDQAVRTVITKDSVEADIVMTAHAVKRWTVTAAVSGASGTSAADPTIQSGVGVIGGTNNKVATIDENGVVKITADPSDEQQVKGWAITGGDGKLYSDAACTTAITTPATHTGTTVYAKAITANATVTVTFESREYEITVQVNKDNAAYAGVKVKLNNSGTEETTNAAGQAKFTVNAGTYTAWANGTDGTHAAAVTSTEKSTTVNADHNAATDRLITVNYYTVNVAKAFSDGRTSTAHFANHGAATTAANETANKTKIVLAKEAAQPGMAVGATANNQTGTTPFYRFNSWSASTNSGVIFTTNAASGEFTLPAESVLTAKTGDNFNITADNQITLTATFQRQYKVSVTEAQSWAGIAQNIKLSTAADTAWGPDSVFVDAGGTVDVQTTGSQSGWKFKEWAIKTTDPAGQGKFENHTTDDIYDAAIGTRNRDAENHVNKFKPEADTTLVLNMWQSGLASGGGWLLDIGTGSSTNENNQTLKQLQFTAHDGQEPDSVEVKGAKESAAAILTKNTDYTVAFADGVYTYTFKDSYLNNRPVDTYTVTFNYMLGENGHDCQYTMEKSNTQNFSIARTAYTLEKVNIKVENGSGTANPGDANRDTVTYEYHTPDLPNGIDPDDLSYVWYYADTAEAPKQGKYTDTTPPATWERINKAGGDPVTDNTVSVTNAMEGKVIFAIVTASDTGTGTVATNAIPVDFNAKITVTENGPALTAGTGYSVYLWPSDGGTFNKSDSKAVGTTFNATSKKFETAAAALTAGKTYHVYVQEVEGNATVYLRDPANTEIKTTNQSATVDYFTVTLTDVPAGNVTHEQDDSTPKQSAGETFTGYPTFKAATGNGTNIPKVTTGTGVLKGSAVTAKANETAAGSGIGWTQDYTLTWQKKEGAATTYTDATQQQKDAAATTGYAYTTSLTTQVELSGKLKQNVYTIKGDIKGTGGTVAGATLTFGGYTFNADSIGNSGAPGTKAIVTFTVPKSGIAAGAITDSYTIKATPGDNTTIQGYSVPSKDAKDQTDPMQLQAVAANGEGKFTIFVAATDLRIEVKDADNADHKQVASGTGTATVTHSDKEKFADYSALTRVVTITNKGNTPLNVTLGITKDAGTTVYDGTQTLSTGNTLTDGNGVTIAGLERTFSLAVNASKSFTVTIPADLNNDDDVEYHFNFTTKDGRDGVTANGPTGVYNLNVVIDPLTVSKVTTTKVRDAGGTGKVIRYDVATTEVAEDTDPATAKPHYDALVTKEDAGYDKDSNADIVYEWYVAPWDAKVTLNKTTGKPEYKEGPKARQPLDTGNGARGTNNLTYTPDENEHGMALFLVAKGQRDATSAAMTPDVDAPDPEPVELVPYAASIQIIQNTTPITTTANAAGYKVKLRLKNPPTTMPDNVPSTVTATWDNTAGVFKTEERLWASDPEHPDTANPWTYEVWANTVKGDDTLQNTGKTITVGDAEEEVIYYQVNINDTSVNQNIYDGTGKIDPTADTTHFYANAPHDPTAKTTTGNINVADEGWVQTGTNVTFTYAQWDKDYNLAWTGGLTASNTAAQGKAGAVTQAATYSSQLDPVDTTLTLNLYPVRVNVKGPVGWVNYITMALDEGTDTYTFTTKSGDGNILGIGAALTSTNERIAAGKTVTFQLPKADGYTTLAYVATATADNGGVTSWKYTYRGADTAGDLANPGAKTIDVNVTGTANQDTYDVVLQGAGLSMEVAETALPSGDTSGAAFKSDQAGIPDGEADPTTGTVTQTIHLNYHYAAGQTVTVKVANTNTDARSIYNVTWTEVTSNNISMAGTFAGGTMAAGADESVTLNIADGKKVGDTINYTATVTFDNGQTGAAKKTASVTYNLTVIVDPLPFNTVTTQTASGTHSIKDYTVKELVTNNILTNDTQTGLTAGSANDYLYQWVRADIGTTPTVTWDGTAATENDLITVTGGTKISGATNSSYTPVTDDEGKTLYLVIFATKDGNASGYAISDPITTGYTGLIRVNVDGVQVTGTSDPNYTVKFVPSDATKPTVDGTWNGATDNTAGYTATLDPEVASYSVQVSRAQGDATNLVPLTGVTITNDDRDADAYYFTVTAKPFNPKHYIPGSTDETFADAEKKFTMTVGSGASATALTSNTPVLSGQSVTAKANGWGDHDYKLTWQSANTTTNVSVDAATADKGAAQTTGTASGTGYTQTITDTTFLGGRLDQNTYTVTGHIKNPDGKTGGVVDKVELAFKPTETGDTRAFTLTANAAANTGDHVFVDDSANGGFGDVDDTVTFTVVRGEYNITAYEGNNATITSVTIGGAGDSKHATEVNTSTTWATRNKETMTPEVEDDTRLFSIYVEGRDLRLKVEDDHTTPHETTSTMTSDNTHTEHPAVYYFNGIPAGTSVDLTLSNPGNAALTVSGTATKTTTMPTSAEFAAGTVGNAVDGSEKVTFSGVPSNQPLAVGGTLGGGKIALAADAANTDDMIYIVKFTSTTTDTANTPYDGPTVYYVFNLTVDPLPIVGVDAVKDDTTGVMSLEGQAGTNGGLDHVWVDHDGSAATAAEPASDHGIVAGDVSYAWAKADVGVTVDESKFELSGTTIAPKTGVTDVTIIPGATGKTYTPVAADSGKNIYLIAYRKNANSNATDFAVSDALYANVTVAFHAYQTGHATELTEVHVTGTYDGGTPVSSAGTITTKNANDPIAFVADMADNATPADATYYFKEWDPATMTAGADRYHKTLTVTEPTTVIGYYDLLPVLTPKSQGYVGGDDDVEGNRTMTYTPNDGSGETGVIVVIEPVGASTFQDGTTGKRELPAWGGAWEKVAGDTPAVGTNEKMGKQGAYVLDKDWIAHNLNAAGSSYAITFYDTAKGQYSAPMAGTANADGYAGYDRTCVISINAGNYFVTARVEDTDSNVPDIQGQGKIKIAKNDTDLATADEKLQDRVKSEGGNVSIDAIPDRGYVFDHWEIITGTGFFGASTDDQTVAAKVAQTTFTPNQEGCVVEAHFRAATFEVTDARVDAVYGDKTLTVTTPFAATPEEGVTGLTFTYTPPADLPDWVTLAPNGDITFTTTVGKTVDTNVETADATGATYADKDELNLTVTVTEDHSGKSVDVHLVINVDQGALTVNHDANENTAEERGTAYIAANIAAGKPVAVADDINNVPRYNETVLKQLFAYTSVTDQANTVIDATGHAGDAANGDSGVYANGTWSVDPNRFQGTDAPSTYKFTFAYKPDSPTEKWNYTVGETDMTLTIAKPPVGAEFADIIGNFADVENVLKPGNWTNGDDSDYSLVAVPADYNGTSGKAPVEMDYTDNTFRKNETITYLDKAPTYTAKLKSVDDDIYGVKLTVESKGFTVGDLPTFADGTFDKNDGVKEITLDLAAMEGNVWANDPEDVNDIHRVKITLTGYSSADKLEEGDAPDVTATYELTVKILPRVITKLDVTVTDPDETVTEATPTIDGNPPIDEDGRDEKGNTPIKDVTVVWGPEENKPDGKNTEVKVDVEIDPNYVYAEENDETPEKEDITENTGVRVTDHLTPDPDVQRDETDGNHIIHIDQKIPYLMHADVNAADATDVTGPKVNDQRTININKGGRLETYTIDLGAYGADLYDVQWTVVEDTVTPADTGLGATLGELPTGFDLTAGDKQSVTLDLSAADTSKPDTYKLTLLALGKANATDPDDARTIRSTYALVITIRKPNDPYNPPEPECPCKVFYHVGTHGVTEDATIEDVSEKNRPSKIPAITALDGYVFRGWSLTDPATLKDGEKAELVDPRTVEAEGEAMTFYAIFVESGVHKHYIVGYPNGNFGPADNITRASVATIIARAVLSDFVEGSDYGNPGNYNDVEGHWAASAIAYCSKFGVFKGYEDGTFRPDEPITRQEFATVMARMDGELTAEDIPFDDIDEAGEWALDGIYTSYEKGWVDGYTDGTFRPLNNIRRDEAVKIFNAYLYRGVDADGLSDLYEHAQGVIGNGENEYKTWTDVPEGQWAYYEIIEASNDHEYALDFEAEKGYTVPEHWVKCWLVDHARSRVKTESAETAAAAVASGFRVWFH